MLLYYSDVEFIYKEVLYGVFLTNNETIKYGCSPTEHYTFDNPDELMENVKTFDSRLLKDAWHEV